MAWGWEKCGLTAPAQILIKVEIVAATSRINSYLRPENPIIRSIRDAEG